MSNFKEWLLNTRQQFLNWSDDERNQILHHLISISSSSQLIYLEQVLPTLLYRDFFKLLPREITVIILTYLDTKSILNCLLVSQHWYELINSLPEVWRHCCLQHYIKIDTTLCSALFYKNLFLKITSKQLEPLRQSDIYDEKFLEGHLNNIIALHYHNGRLASGSNDRSVIIWNYETGERQTLPQSKSVSTIKLTDKSVYVSFFNGSVHSWDNSQGPQLQFIGHVSAVYSIDVCQKLSILVTGSADRTLKIWDLQSGQLLKTLMGHHENWIIETKIISEEGESSYTLISSDTTVCYIRRMNSEHDQIQVETISCPNHFIIPHLLIENKRFLKICFQTNCEDNAVIRIYQFQSKVNLVHQYKITQTVKQIRLLLGVGQKMAMVISRGDLYFNLNLMIFGLHTNEVILRKSLPAIRISLNGSSVTCGSLNWLDGFVSCSPVGLLLAAAAIGDNTIYILSWKDDSIQAIENQETLS